MEAIYTDTITDKVFGKYLEEYKTCVDNLFDMVVDSPEVNDQVNIYHFCEVHRKIPNISLGTLSMKKARELISKDTCLSRDMSFAIQKLNSFYKDLLGCYNNYFINMKDGVLAADESMDYLTSGQAIALQRTQEDMAGELANLCDGVNTK